MSSARKPWPPIRRWSAEATQGTAWIVDPLDGTGNFAAGRTPFAIMVALAEGGVVQAGWILDPVTRRMCHAALGGGAFIDNRPDRGARHRQRPADRRAGDALPAARRYARR